MAGFLQQILINKATQNSRKQISYHIFHPISPQYFFKSTINDTNQQGVDSSFIM